MIRTDFQSDGIARLLLADAGYRHDRLFRGGDGPLQRRSKAAAASRPLGSWAVAVATAKAKAIPAASSGEMTTCFIA